MRFPMIQGLNFMGVFYRYNQIKNVIKTEGIKAPCSLYFVFLLESFKLVIKNTFDAVLNDLCLYNAFCSIHKKC